MIEWGAWPVTYPGGRVVTESNDFRGRLSRIDDGLPAPIAQYSYDTANRIVTRTYRSGAVSSNAYNANDWITNLTHRFGASVLAGFAYAYDSEGNKIFEQNLATPARSEAYRYDAEYRLTNFAVGTLSGTNIPAAITRSGWDLDALGNWNSRNTDGTNETRTHNAANEVTTIGGSPVTHDNNGNLSFDGTHTYTYDQENRLTDAVRLDVMSAGHYQYDALGRRVLKVAYSNGVPSETRFYYDGARIIEDRDAGNVAVATYVYGVGIDEVLTMTRGADTYYHYQNALGSVVAVTANNGTVANERYSYDAYGQTRITDGTGSVLRTNNWGTPHSLIGAPYLFTGRQLDEESGLYFYRARSYDAGKGRFMQRDPLDSVSMNLYEYVGSSPPNATDPSGLIETDAGSTTSEDDFEKAKTILDIPVLFGLIREKYSLVTVISWEIKDNCGKDGKPPEGKAFARLEASGAGAPQILLVKVTSLRPRFYARGSSALTLQ